MKRLIDTDYPIVIGISGKAGTGKTVTADQIVPGVVKVTHIKDDEPIGSAWDHFTLASPLYEMASIKQKISGRLREDRILHELHQVLFNLLGKSPLYGLPKYDDFIEVVRAVYNEPTPGEDVKPRSFLQNVGDLCRNIDEDCFVKSLRSRIYEQRAVHKASDEFVFAALVSDVRFQNEAEWISTQPNGLMINLIASDEVRRERLINRDGSTLNVSQSTHHSEDLLIPDHLIDFTINTDDLSVADQKRIFVDHIYDTFGDLADWVQPEELDFAKSK